MKSQNPERVFKREKQRDCNDTSDYHQDPGMGLEQFEELRINKIQKI